jgi:hypothetical protein
MADAAAAARVPWIATEWDLIDLQIEQRGGRLSCSLAEQGVLRLRAGDSFRLAVLFFDIGGAVNPSMTSLRWSLRDAANLELIGSVSVSNPAAVTDGNQPYFLLLPDIARLGSAAREALGESVALPCLMDVDWMISGKVYSSTTMPVMFEFGLGSQAGGTGGGASGPNTPTPPVTPPPLPPPPVTPDSPTLADELPVGEGFLYVKNGRLIAVPAGDCTTGQKWSPTT